MKINDEIYPVINDLTYTTYTKKISEFALNKEINDNIVYSVSGGNYAANSANLILNIAGTQASNIILQLYNKQFSQNLLLSADAIDGYGPHDNSRLYDTRMGFNVSAFPVYNNQNLYDLNLIRGYRYYSEIACIYVTYRTNNNPVSVATADLKTYLANHSDKTILNIYVKMWAGSSTTRNLQTVYLTHYDNRNSIYFSTAEENANEEIINYTVDIFRRNANTTSPQLNSGYLLFGLVAFDTYYTNVSRIDNTRAGTVFYNSNFSKCDWGNMVNVSNNQRPCFIPSYNLNTNDILSMAATLGVLFTPDESIARTLDLSKAENIVNNDLYFPVYDDEKVWYGNYTHGVDNLTTDQYKDNWNGDKNAPFTNGSPSVSDINPSLYSNGETLKLPTPAASFTNMYLITAANLKNLVNWLNPADDDIFDGLLDGLKFAGSNPLNSITNIMQFPVSVPAASNAENVVIGKLTSPVVANRITTTTFEIDAGTTEPIYAFNKNWLDYEPYTQYVAWVPYCGWVELSANVITNKRVSFKLEIDLISGSCTCRILVNGVQYKTINGNVGTQFAVQAEDTKAYTQSVLNSLGKMGGGFATTVAGVAASATGAGAAIGIPAALAGFGNSVAGFWDFVCPQENFSQIGTMTGNVSSFCPRKVNIYRFYTTPAADENYGEYVGYACEFSETLSNLSGFCMVSNADTTGIVATDTELKEIISILESGFYI